MTHNPKDIKFLSSLIDQIKTTPPPAKISEYVEGHRVLPQDTPYPGPWRNEVTPYLIEIMDNFSPASNIQHVALMKGAQLGATTSGENVIGYFMDAVPAPMMILSATESAIKGWGEVRLDPLLDSLDLRGKLTSSLEGNKKSRKTGDTISKKIFPGGYLLLASAQSASSMRSWPVRVLIRDEIDGAPTELKTGEGNWLSVSEARTNSDEVSRKIFDLSTPTTIQQSNIYREYKKGDQRHYFVPCPHCGEMQYLEMGGKATKYGLKGNFNDKGMLEYAYYVCKHCEGHILNHHKTEMLKHGEWRPTAEATERFYRSYWLPSLYSPVGFLSWTGLYQKYHNAKDDLDNRRSFVNLYLGLPFKQAGIRPDIKKVLELINGSTYKEGTVPKYINFLTMAIDVQTGDKNPRLALEILGHAKGFKTASILYKEIAGAVDNPYEGAWKKLREWIESKDSWGFRRQDGVILYPKIAAIDSGEGSTHQEVYNFCQMMGDSFWPIKGFNAIKNKQKKHEDVDEYDPAKATKRFELSRIDSNLSLIRVGTVNYKNHIYNNLTIKRPEEGDDLPNGFCDFPMDRGDKYFQMLTAEEKLTDGSFKDFGRRNEALDVRVYNLCIADFYLGRMLNAYRKAAMKDGHSEEEVKKKIDHDFIFDRIEERNLAR